MCCNQSWMAAQIHFSSLCMLNWSNSFSMTGKPCIMLFNIQLWVHFKNWYLKGVPDQTASSLMILSRRFWLKSWHRHPQNNCGKHSPPLRKQENLNLFKNIDLVDIFNNSEMRETNISVKKFFPKIALSNCFTPHCGCRCCSSQIFKI